MNTFSGSGYKTPRNKDIPSSDHTGRATWVPKLHIHAQIPVIMTARL